MKLSSLTKNQIVVCESLKEVQDLFTLFNKEGLRWCNKLEYDPNDAEYYFRGHLPVGFCPARGSYCDLNYWRGLSKLENLEFILLKTLISKPKAERSKKYKVTLTTTLEKVNFTSMKNVKTFVVGKESSFLIEFDDKPIIGGHGKNIFGKPQYVKAFKKRGYKTQT